MDLNILQNGRLLLMTKPLQVAPAGGRELLCKLNYEALHSLCGDRLVLCELQDEGFVGAALNAFRGHIDGITDASIEQALESIRNEHITQVFVEYPFTGFDQAAIFSI